MSGDFAIQRIWGQIRIVWPAHGTKFIDSRLGEKLWVFQWLEHWPEQPVSKAHLAMGAIVESDREGVFRLGFYIGYSAHDAYSKGSILLSG
jgi:hypothetical protein